MCDYEPLLFAVSSWFSVFVNLYSQFNKDEIHLLIALNNPSADVFFCWKIWGAYRNLWDSRISATCLTRDIYPFKGCRHGSNNRQRHRQAEHILGYEQPSQLWNSECRIGCCPLVHCRSLESIPFSHLQMLRRVGKVVIPRRRCRPTKSKSEIESRLWSGQECRGGNGYLAIVKNVAVKSDCI